MPAHRHARSRSHRRPIPFEVGGEPFVVWFPPSPDLSPVLADFSDAAHLAFEVFDLPVEREALVLLDEFRRVTAILVDPPAPLGLLIGWSDLPGLEVPFCQTLSIVAVDSVGGAPSEADLAGYHGLRRMHVLQGLQLLDVLLVAGERVQSLAIAGDPDAVWFTPFEPLTAPDTPEAA